MDSTQSILQRFYREGPKKFMTCFSAFLQTDAKASVLKVDESLCEKYLLMH